MAGVRSKMELLTEILTKCWELTVEMAPYLLLGFAIAGAISAFLTPEIVERHLGGRGLWPVVKASLFGIPLPLCSCGVIPVTASLRKHGAGKGATLSFLLSTPQTGVDSILVTYSMLGPIFAVFRPIAAFVTGLVGGMAADILDGDDPKAPGSATCNEEECCGANTQRPNRFTRALRHGFIVLPRDIAVPMIVGILIAGTVAAVVPDDFFAGHLGTGIVSMLIMMAVSVPVYVCAIASVPIAAAMILKGLSVGAAFVFLVAGPATNAATLTTLWKILGRRSVFIYLATVALTALASGIAMNAIFAGKALPLASAPAHAHEHATGAANVFGTVCAAALIALLIGTRVAKFLRDRKDSDDDDDGGLTEPHTTSH